MALSRRSGAGRKRGRRALALLPVLLALLPPVAGCARRRPAAERPASLPLAVQVYADTGRGGRLEVRPPMARVLLARVTPAPAVLPELPPPEAVPADPPSAGEVEPALEVDAGLKPPVLRAPVRLLLPVGRRTAADWVDFDVRVDEAGAVDEALWRAGSADTSLVQAARRCALSMRFYPALMEGRAVAVWCRQRFDFRTAAAALRPARAPRAQP